MPTNNQYSITEDPDFISLDEPNRPINVVQNGWTAIISNVDRENEDGSIDLVQKIVDWTGGYGTKPQINLYLYEAGFTANEELAKVISNPSWTPVYSYVERTNEDTSKSIVVKIIDWNGTYGVKPPINVYIGSENEYVENIDAAVAISGQNGVSTIFRFAVNTSSNIPPSITNTLNPDGWSVEPQSLVSGQYRWKVQGFQKLENILLGSWSTPIIDGFIDVSSPESDDDVFDI
jgi:hypothetical protein